MTMPGEPGYPGPEEGTPVMTDLSNPEQHDSAAAVPAAAEPGAAAKPEQDPRPRLAELEAELAKLRSAAVTGLKVLLRVTSHESMSYGGVTVTDQPTEVPAHMVPALHEAAANAGVTLVQEEG